MPRFSERKLQWADVIGRFEARQYLDHLRNALGIIGLVKDEGAKLWEGDSNQRKNWERYCADLLSFLNTLGQRRDLRQQDLGTAMREFIQEFEHSTARMYQMLYGVVAAPDSDKEVREIVDWFYLAYVASTYALVSAWTDDKQETASLRTIVDVATGEVREEGTRTEKRVPKRYRKSTKRL